MGKSRDIDLADLRLLEDLPGRRIFYMTLIETHFSTHLQQSISSVDPAVRQDSRIALDIALRVMSVREVAC